MFGRVETCPAAVILSVAKNLVGSVGNFSPTPFPSPSHLLHLSHPLRSLHPTGGMPLRGLCASIDSAYACCIRCVAGVSPTLFFFVALCLCPISLMPSALLCVLCASARVSLFFVNFIPARRGWRTSWLEYSWAFRSTLLVESLICEHLRNLRTFSLLLFIAPLAPLATFAFTSVVSPMAPGATFLPKVERCSLPPLLCLCQP